MRHRYLAPLAATSLAALLGCGSPTSVQPERQGPTTASIPTPATSPAAPSAEPPSKAAASEADMEAAAKGDAEFALGLYSKVKGDGNVLLSPASARVALAMAYAGARGRTAEQMARVLALPDDPRVHGAFGALLDLWGSWANVEVPSAPEAPSEPFRLRVANRLFGQQGRPFAPAYLSLLAEDYAAPLEQVDFRSEPDAARRHINDWVEDRTEKRIQDLLPAGSVQPDTRLVLVNAIYFKADWALKFDRDATRDADFSPAPGERVTARMMTQTGQYRYAETDDAQVLEMPYLGAPASLLVVLPKARDGLARVEESLTPAAIAGWVGKLSPERVTVQLPRFKVESTFRLGDTLASMGMTDAVDPTKADFSGIDGTRELSLGEVIQKTFCAVDEAGTEAAAATAVVMRATAAYPSDPPRSFVADHPFLFLLRDMKTGSILFMGRLARPA